MSSKPQDEPTMNDDFHVDPMVSELYVKTEPYFGLVVNAGWPPSSETIDSYNQFLSMVKMCFDPEDLTGSTPAVYLYPGSCLHITVSTLYPLKPVRAHGSNIDFDEITSTWKELVLAAANRPEWPTKPLQLEMDSAQIGIKAGILLWKEMTGGLEAMRFCLTEEAQERNLQIHNTPGIIHSTFLRFYDQPSTKGNDIQNRFQRHVLPKLSDIFSNPIPANDAKLVCERTPYMHIPNDSDHVFLCLSFSEETS